MLMGVMHRFGVKPTMAAVRAGRALIFAFLDRAWSAHDARASSCVADEIGQILFANLTELRCTAVEAG
jgi:hypothetical protein